MYIQLTLVLTKTANATQFARWFANWLFSVALDVIYMTFRANL